jgi:hypothetical protein
MENQDIKQKYAKYFACKTFADSIRNSGMIPYDSCGKCVYNHQNIRGYTPADREFDALYHTLSSSGILSDENIFKKLRKGVKR